MTNKTFHCEQSEQVLTIIESGESTCARMIIVSNTDVQVPGMPIDEIKTENGVKIINTRRMPDLDREMQLRMSGRRLSVTDGFNTVIIHLSAFHANRFIEAIGWK